MTFNANNVATGVPTEALTPNGPISRFAIEIRRVAGTGASHLKWIANGVLHRIGARPSSAPAQAIDPDASSARGALTVAAVRQNDVGLDTAESFSSRGPTVTRYLDKDGNRLATPEVRPKPDLAGADGVAVSSGFDTGPRTSTPSSARAPRRRARPVWRRSSGRRSRR